MGKDDKEGGGGIFGQLADAIDTVLGALGDNADRRRDDRIRKTKLNKEAKLAKQQLEELGKQNAAINAGEVPYSSGAETLSGVAEVVGATGDVAATVGATVAGTGFLNNLFGGGGSGGGTSGGTIDTPLGSATANTGVAIAAAALIAVVLLSTRKGR